MPIITLLILFAVMPLGSLLLFDVLNPRRARVTARLQSVRNPERPAARRGARALFFERVLAPAITAASRWGAVLTPQAQRDRLVQKLQQAGHHRAVAINTTMAVKAVGVIASLGAAWLVGLQAGPAGVLIAGVGVAISLVAPEIVINRHGRRSPAGHRARPARHPGSRHGQRRGGPDDGRGPLAHRQPAQQGPVRPASEFSRYLQGIRLGTARAEALEGLGKRCGVADLQSVVAALQADSLGVGIGTVLRAQSQHLRTRRKQRAQEAAMKAPVKMLFPLVLFIFPSIFIVTLGPAVIRIIDTFASK